MKDNNWLFIGTDSRLAACSEIMFERGFATHHIGTDHYSDELGETIAELFAKANCFPDFTNERMQFLLHC